jgi:hypothetical protein
LIVFSDVEKMPKLKRNTILKAVIIISLIFITLLYSSYRLSRSAADQLVGETLNYFTGCDAILALEPLKRDRIVWVFKYYSSPFVFTDEFYIYTTLNGKIATTNPKDLKNRLRNLEKLRPHPYSPEAREVRRKNFEMVENNQNKQAK